MKIYCISEGKLWRADGKSPEQIECGRIRDYLKAVNDMKKRDEWKTTGKGAMFMNAEAKDYDTESVFLRAVGTDGERLIYSTYIDSVGGMYFKDTANGDETYIFANQTFDPGRMSFGGGKCCIETGEGPYERHIAVLDIKSGGIDSITEGFTCESSPFISRIDPGRIYYSAMGYAQDSIGRVLEKSPCSIAVYDSRTNELSDVVSDSGYDHLKPCDDADGNLYYIRRKYEPMHLKSNIGKDIVMFPVRLVRAIGGFLSIFSMRYGGEPLRTGGRNPAKSREADERDLFVEGNLIKAKKIGESAEGQEEGVIPSDWVLIKRSVNGEETVLLKGVMDYRLLDDGRIVYSDGAWIRIRNTDGSTGKVCSLKLANCITVIGE